ncbi:unnamed protein product [Ilex paraguariensis]|uniref:Uncharacterized protein n=1 Tax=Ilex paraguariensis TaxID=185542 RepID=A0ABC8UW09_9AQUA
MNRQKGSTYQATLLRSPDRSIGLGDATRRVRGLQYDMRCALVPVGITKFSKLIERATEFKENTPAETQPLPDHQAYYSLNLPTASANIATAETEDDVEEENLPIQPSSTSSVSPSPSLPAPSHLSNRPLPDLNLPPAPSPEPAPPAPLSAEEEQDLLTKREQVKRVNCGYS